MHSFIIVVIIALIIGLQTLFGYLENKVLGAIFPVIFIIFYIYLFINGSLHIKFWDICAPLIFLLSMTLVWEGGKNKKSNKRKKELDKMKTKDYLK